MLVCVLHIDLCVKLLAIEVVVEPPVCMQLCGCIIIIISLCILDESVGLVSVCSIVGNVCLFSVATILFARSFILARPTSLYTYTAILCLCMENLTKTCHQYPQGAMVAGINFGGGLGNLLAGSKLPPILFMIGV